MKQNTSLRRQALIYGFRVIDTLQMTLSRYKEFVQGACACHFHKVSVTLNIIATGWTGQVQGLII